LRSFTCSGAGAFILDGARGSIFGTYFGSAVTTLLTITLLIVVSFSIAALSAEQATQALRVRPSHGGLTGLLSGHAAGDAALNAFASACRDSVRSNDLVGRYGGEEFFLFLPGATPEQAARVTEQISSAMKDSDAGFVLPTVSYGIAPVSAAGDALKAAIAAADAALYQAKARGRNRSILATGSEYLSRLSDVLGAGS
jgi:Diguanylate cyclase, GGDEF domain